jgi:hypothetical protein
MPKKIRLIFPPKKASMLKVRYSENLNTLQMTQRKAKFFDELTLTKKEVYEWLKPFGMTPYLLDRTINDCIEELTKVGMKPGIHRTFTMHQYMIIAKNFGDQFLHVYSKKEGKENTVDERIRALEHALRQICYRSEYLIGGIIHEYFKGYHSKGWTPNGTLETIVDELIRIQLITGVSDVLYQSWRNNPEIRDLCTNYNE